MEHILELAEILLNVTLDGLHLLGINERALEVHPQILEKDVLLSYPFESMKSFINLLYEAAEDESVVSIKMTLYRLANKSQIVDALVEAAENGKEVVVLVELRARFDEENNIEYSRKLEEAGCRVIYGLNGYKVHSKLCLISRKTEQGVSYVTQIGTGNYNEKTSALYTDLSLITGNQEIGKEAAEVFAALLRGETVEETHLLLVAPKCLQNKVLDMIEEIQHVKNGEEGYIGIKINSLTDKVIISKLVEASQAGVKIEMIVRGICCLIPGVKGYTENITVISIVGRFLEHSRIYRFGTKERENVYISSADFMTRNTLKRVEVAGPVYDESIKERILHMFNIMLKDNVKARIMGSDGNYYHKGIKEGEESINSQEYFYDEAIKASR
jgi:polyphosphate kinase